MCIDQNRKSISAARIFFPQPDHVQNFGFKFAGVGEQVAVTTGDCWVCDEGTHAKLMVEVNPFIDHVTDFVGNFRLIDAEENAAGQSQHKVGHVAVNIPFGPWNPVGEHRFHFNLNRRDIIQDRLLHECIHDHAAVTLMLFAVHAEQPGRQPTLGRMSRSSNGEELRMKRAHVAEHLMVELRPEHEINPLPLFFHRTDVAVFCM